MKGCKSRTNIGLYAFRLCPLVWLYNFYYYIQLFHLGSLYILALTLRGMFIGIPIIGQRCGFYLSCYCSPCCCCFSNFSQFWHQNPLQVVLTKPPQLGSATPSLNIMATKKLTTVNLLPLMSLNKSLWSLSNAPCDRNLWFYFWLLHWFCSLEANCSAHKWWLHDCGTLQHS